MENTFFSKAPRLKVPQQEAFGRALEVLNSSVEKYLVAGALAEHAYTGIWRNTNDLDIFLKAEDVYQALKALADAGFDTRVEDTRWLAKAFWGNYLIDMIFNMSNGLLPVADTWFEDCRKAEIAGVKTRIISLEDLIAAKVYIALRLRFDGADVVHLIRSSRGQIDWEKVVFRLGENRELLLWHLIMFDYVYPGHGNYLPSELIDRLYQEMCVRWKSRSRQTRNGKPFRGALLDPYSFRVDIEQWGYDDLRRLAPAIDEEGRLL